MHTFNLPKLLAVVRSLYVTLHGSHCVQVYRIEYPGEIRLYFALALEEGGENTSANVPEFYLVTLTDLNGRETFEVNGMSMLVLFLNCLAMLSFMLQCCQRSD